MAGTKNDSGQSFGGMTPTCIHKASLRPRVREPPIASRQVFCSPLLHRNRLVCPSHRANPLNHSTIRLDSLLPQKMAPPHTDFVHDGLFKVAEVSADRIHARFVFVNTVVAKSVRARTYQKLSELPLSITVESALKPDAVPSLCDHLIVDTLLADTVIADELKADVIWYGDTTKDCAIVPEMQERFDPFLDRKTKQSGFVEDFLCGLSLHRETSELDACSDATDDYEMIDTPRTSCSEGTENLYTQEELPSNLKQVRLSGEGQERSLEENTEEGRRPREEIFGGRVKKMWLRRIRYGTKTPSMLYLVVEYVNHQDCLVQRKINLDQIIRHSERGLEWVPKSSLHSGMFSISCRDIHINASTGVLTAKSHNDPFSQVEVTIDLSSMIKELGGELHYKGLSEETEAEANIPHFHNDVPQTQARQLLNGVIFPTTTQHDIESETTQKESCPGSTLTLPGPTEVLDSCGNFCATSKNLKLQIARGLAERHRLILAAECYKPDGSCMTSEIDLDAFLENDDGELMWVDDGERPGLFSHTARNIRLTPGTDLLEVELADCDGVWVQDVIRLGQRIENVNGVLEFRTCEELGGLSAQTLSA